MDNIWKTAVWQQFGAALDTLGNAITTCPEQLWSDQSRYHRYWYMAYHTLFWLDFYLSESPEGFSPPAPFGLEEMDPAGVLPPRMYSKEELLTYLNHGRQKAKAAIEALTDEQAHQRYVFGRMDICVAEKFLYIMRHVQHHAAQLNLILRQEADLGSKWVFKAKE